MEELKLLCPKTKIIDEKGKSTCYTFLRFSWFIRKKGMHLRYNFGKTFFSQSGNACVFLLGPTTEKVLRTLSSLSTSLKVFKHSPTYTKVSSSISNNVELAETFRLSSWKSFLIKPFRKFVSPKNCNPLGLSFKSEYQTQYIAIQKQKLFLSKRTLRSNYYQNLN